MGNCCSSSSSSFVEPKQQQRRNVVAANDLKEEQTSNKQQYLASNETITHSNNSNNNKQQLYEPTLHDPTTVSTAKTEQRQEDSAVSKKLVSSSTFNKNEIHLDQHSSNGNQSKLVSHHQQQQQKQHLLLQSEPSGKTNTSSFVDNNEISSIMSPPNNDDVDAEVQNPQPVVASNNSENDQIAAVAIPVAATSTPRNDNNNNAATSATLVTVHPSPPPAAKEKEFYTHFLKNKCPLNNHSNNNNNNSLTGTGRNTSLLPPSDVLLANCNANQMLVGNIFGSGVSLQNNNNNNSRAASVTGMPSSIKSVGIESPLYMMSSPPASVGNNNNNNNHSVGINSSIPRNPGLPSFITANSKANASNNNNNNNNNNKTAASGIGSQQTSSTTTTTPAWQKFVSATRTPKQGISPGPSGRTSPQASSLVTANSVRHDSSPPPSTIAHQQQNPHHHQDKDKDIFNSSVNSTDAVSSPVPTFETELGTNSICITRENSCFNFISAKNINDGVTDNEAIDCDLTGAPESFDFESTIIGGGPAGLTFGGTSCWLQPHLQCRFALINFVQPSETAAKTTWKMGGTCLNAGCVPKKLLHFAGLLGENILSKSEECGWRLKSAAPAPAPADDDDDSSTTTTTNTTTTNTTTTKYHCNWQKVLENINNHSRSLSFKYTSTIRNKTQVRIMNKCAKVIDRWTFEVSDDTDPTTIIMKSYTSRRIVIATGTRPVLPSEEECANARKFGITSDDLFWLKQDPKNTLIVGGGYVALETASFLNGIGRSVTVMMRSDVALRDFDQECVQILIEKMKENGVRFITNFSVKRLDKKDEDGQIQVTFVSTRSDDDEQQQQQQQQQPQTEFFDTVLFAIGRKADEEQARNLKEKVGVEIDPKTNRILVDKWNRTSVSNIYAVGDVCQMKNLPVTYSRTLGFSTVAAKSGILLANRLYRPATRSAKKSEEVCSPAVCKAKTEAKALDSIEKVGCPGADDPTTDHNPSADQQQQQQEEGCGETCVATKKYYFQKTLDLTSIPTVVSLSPFEFACVGASEEYKTVNSNISVERFYFDPESQSAFTMKSVTTNSQQQHRQCFLKLIIDSSQLTEKGGKVIGAHLVAPNAAEILQGFAVAVNAGASLEDFEEMFS